LSRGVSLEKSDTEFKYVPVYASGWLIVYEGLKSNPCVYTFKILDMKNRRTLAVIRNEEELTRLQAKGGKNRNMNLGYLYFIGSGSKNQIFTRSDFSIFSIEASRRRLVTLDEQTICDPE
jgi:hypothetical protein